MALSDDQILDVAATTQLYNHALPAIRFARAIEAEARRDALEEAAKVCDEMLEHYSALKDTALLNGDVALSNASSGEPRACEFLAAAIRKLKEDMQ